jgi:hypothetical protein
MADVAHHNSSHDPDGMNYVAALRVARQSIGPPGRLSVLAFWRSGVLAFWRDTTMSILPGCIPEPRARTCRR